MDAKDSSFFNLENDVKKVNFSIIPYTFPIQEISMIVKLPEVFFTKGVFWGP